MLVFHLLPCSSMQSSVHFILPPHMMMMTVHPDSDHSEFAWKTGLSIVGKQCLSFTGCIKQQAHKSEIVSAMTMQMSQFPTLFCSKLFMKGSNIQGMNMLLFCSRQETRDWVSWLCWPVSLPMPLMMLTLAKSSLSEQRGLLFDCERVFPPGKPNENVTCSNDTSTHTVTVKYLCVPVVVIMQTETDGYTWEHLTQNCMHEAASTCCPVLAIPAAVRKGRGSADTDICRVCCVTWKKTRSRKLSCIQHAALISPLLLFEPGSGCKWISPLWWKQDD